MEERKKIRYGPISINAVIPPGTSAEEFKAIFDSLAPSEKEAITYNRFVNDLMKDRGDGRTIPFEKSPGGEYFPGKDTQLSDFEKKIFQEELAEKGLSMDNVEVTRLEFYVCPCCYFMPCAFYKEKGSGEEHRIAMMMIGVSPSKDNYEKVKNFDGEIGMW